MACNCPLPTAMTTITATSCAFNIKEVHRVFVVREGAVIWDIATAGAANVPAAIVGNVVTVAAGWTILRTAADDTKVLTLPLFGSEPTLAAGGQLSSTGLSNVKNHVGFEPSEFVAFFEGLTAIQEGEIADITCEGDTLEVYFVMHDGGIVGSIDNPSTPGTMTGIPLASAMVMFGRSLNGFNDNDKNELQFQLLHDWSQYAYKVVPTDFNALTY
tara:strand:+ start:15 stop:659 length:645 start_codon:yes stop_codon:yes gene_type:complete